MKEKTWLYGGVYRSRTRKMYTLIQEINGGWYREDCMWIRLLATVDEVARWRKGLVVELIANDGWRGCSRFADGRVGVRQRGWQQMEYLKQLSQTNLGFEGFCSENEKLLFWGGTMKWNRIVLRNFLFSSKIK